MQSKTRRIRSLSSTASDSLEVITRYARQKAGQAIQQACGLLAKLPPQDAANLPLRDLVDLAQGDLALGEGVESQIEGKPGSKLSFLSKATRFYTRAQVHAGQVTNALCPPPSSPDPEHFR